VLQRQLHRQSSLLTLSAKSPHSKPNNMSSHRPARRASSLHADVAATAISKDVISTEQASVLSEISWKQRILKELGVAAGDDGLTLRQRLTKMGIFAAISYNAVSVACFGCFRFTFLQFSFIDSLSYLQLRPLSFIHTHTHLHTHQTG
jgi:hypothetical protein